MTYNWHSPNDGEGPYWFYICRTIFCVLMVGGLWLSGLTLLGKLHPSIPVAVVVFLIWSSLMFAWVARASTFFNNPDGTTEWRGFFR